MPDTQQYIWNLYLINNVEDIVVFLGFNSDNLYVYADAPAVKCKITLVEKLKFKKISFQNYEHWF